MATVAAVAADRIPEPRAFACLAFHVGHGICTLSRLQVADLVAGMARQTRGATAALTVLFPAVAGDGCGIISLPCWWETTFIGRLDPSRMAIGVILLLHFGVFDLLAAAWRAAGIEVKSVMRAPLRATSLGDFWGRRWNTAFNTLAHHLAFRPLARRWGRAAAMMATFAISGVIHELVISVPARGGYGLPTVYFLFQGLAVLVERSNAGRRIGLGRGLQGWLFTAVCTAGPAFWLFHPPFVRNVLLPMLRTFGCN